MKTPRHPISKHLRELADRSSNVEYLNTLHHAANELDRLYGFSPDYAQEVCGDPRASVSVSLTDNSVERQ